MHPLLYDEDVLNTQTQRAVHAQHIDGDREPLPKPIISSLCSTTRWRGSVCSECLSSTASSNTSFSLPFLSFSPFLRRLYKARRLHHKQQELPLYLQPQPLPLTLPAHAHKSLKSAVKDTQRLTQRQSAMATMDTQIDTNHINLFCIRCSGCTQTASSSWSFMFRVHDHMDPCRLHVVRVDVVRHRFPMMMSALHCRLLCRCCPGHSG